MNNAQLLNQQKYWCEIYCDVCKRHVEKIEEWRDEATITTAIRVYCHGDSEEMRMDDKFSSQLKENAKGIAFKRKELTK